MKLSVKGFTIACGVLWGGAVLFVMVSNSMWPGYGKVFLDLTSSIYPGYVADGSAKSVIVGTLYGILDGAVAGFLFAIIYNACLCKKE